MVDLPGGKMKSREGTVVDADDLIDEMIETARKHTEELGKIEGLTEKQATELYETLALGALKYFLLKVDPKKRMLFNPEESIQFHGNTGPFIQYTHARISALLRKASEENLEFDNPVFDKLEELDESVISIIYMIDSYPQLVAEAAENFSPSQIAQFIYEVAKEYNKFYTEESIFNEPDKDKKLFKLAFSKQVARTIRLAMDLLGIRVPERM
jgi:arginyl-tRNA synthetase